jgi:hypothetical protein
MTVFFYIIDTTRINCSTVRSLQEEAKEKKSQEAGQEDNSDEEEVVQKKKKINQVSLLGTLTIFVWPLTPCFYPYRYI